MNIISPVVCAYIEKDGKYLFTQRADIDPEDKGLTSESGGIWQTPGGTLEFGEDCEKCLLREIKEEAGVEIEVVALLPKIHTDVRNNTWHGLLIQYFCRMKNPNDPIIINEEASDYKWISYDEIKNYHTFPFTIEGMELAEKIRKNL